MRPERTLERVESSWEQEDHRERPRWGGWEGMCRSCEGCPMESWCGDFWKTDRVDAVGWAAQFIWAAAVIVFVSAGLAAGLAWWNGWSIFFVGAGIIVLAQVAYRALWRTRKRVLVPGIFFGVMMLGFGMSGLGFAGLFWPIALGIAGLSILIGVFGRR